MAKRTALLIKCSFCGADINNPCIDMRARKKLNIGRVISTIHPERIMRYRIMKGAKK